LQHSLFDIAFTTAPKRRTIFALEPGSEDQAIFVTVFAETVQDGVPPRSISDGANEAGFRGIAPKNYWK
jgi:hypothetical protein